jgi:hypothetical protein
MTYLKFFVPILFLFISSSIYAQTSQKGSQIHTLPSGVTKIHIDVPSNRVEILKTKGNRISIETNVRLALGSLSLLEYLIKNGRYELTAFHDSELYELTLSTKENQKELLIKGQQCSEIVTYKIYVPESVEFIQTLCSSQDNFIANH